MLRIDFGIPMPLQDAFRASVISVRDHEVGAGSLPGDSMVVDGKSTNEHAPDVVLRKF